MIERKFRKFYLYGYINFYNNSQSFVKSSGYDSYVDRKIKDTFDYFGLKPPKGNYDKWSGFIIVAEVLFSVIILLGRFVFLSIRKLFKRTVKISGLHLILPLATAQFRVNDMLRSLEGIDVCSVRVPFIKNYFKHKEIDELTVISFSDVFASFISAVGMVFYMRDKFGKRDILFRSYSSFEFFITCRFIQRIEGSNDLVYFNNYDRWAFLFSRANTNKIFIQHGKLDRITRWIKVGTPDTAYFLSHEQEEILLDTLIESRPSKILFRKTLQFHNTEILNKDNGKLNVLVVSASSFIKDVVRIVELLAEEVNLYVKPHPGEKPLPVYEYLVNKYSVRLLEKTDYPEADVVLSYNSTLADEYEIAGVRVIRWDLLENLSDSKALVLGESYKRKNRDNYRIHENRGQ